MTIELMIFRHGRTYWNAEHRYQGHADVELDALGRGQSIAIAQRSSAMNPVRLYCSDLKRAVAVAEQIEKVTGVIAHPDQRLRERDVGAWSGLTVEEIAQRFPDEYELWKRGESGVRPGGGETEVELLARIDSFLGELRDSQLEGKVIVVTHAGWLRSLLTRVLGSSAIRTAFGVAGQASLSEIDIDGDDMKLRSYNDRGHLLHVEEVDTEVPAPQIY